MYYRLNLKLKNKLNIKNIIWLQAVRGEAVIKCSIQNILLCIQSCDKL